MRTAETVHNNEFAMHASDAKRNAHVYERNTVPDAVKRGQESACHVRNYPLNVPTTNSKFKHFVIFLTSYDSFY